VQRAPRQQQAANVLHRINAITSGQRQASSSSLSIQGVKSPGAMFGKRRLNVGGLVSDRIGVMTESSGGIVGASSSDVVVQLSNIHYEVSEDDLRVCLVDELWLICDFYL
jgi:hypothetical protein